MSQYIIDPFFEFGAVPAVTRNAWREIGRIKLSSAGNNIDVINLPNKRYLMFLNYNLALGDITDKLRVNGNSTNIYSNRRSNNGGADIPLTNSDFAAFLGFTPNNNGQSFSVGYIDNLATKEKLMTIHSTDNQPGVGSGVSPSRRENASKFADALNPIDEVNIFQDNTGQLDIDSECVVLGFDPLDGLDATTNFWQPLASTTTIDPTDEFMEVSFSPRKYLWVQWSWLTLPPTNAVQCNLRLGKTTIDIGNNYSFRFSVNNAAETALINQSRILFINPLTDDRIFGEAFIVNENGQEKLLTGHTTINPTGSANTPGRSENVGKWVNPTGPNDQADILRIGDEFENGKIADGTLTIWGHD